VTRLTRQRQDEHAAFQERDLSDRDFVYVWADGVHPKVRLGQAHSCGLVLLGVRLDGTKELVALAEGLRESTESWADLLRDCRRRGMRDPELVVGDGAMGLWSALRDVFPAARHKRCWVHKSRNALPKSAQPSAMRAMQEIYSPEDRAHAEMAIEAFARTYGTKWPKAVAKITDDAEELLAFYDFPAEHRIHLRTTNPIRVLYLCHRPGSSYPARRSKRPALTLNAIGTQTGRPGFEVSGDANGTAWYGGEVLDC
jgi:transposase-like protein